MRLVDFGDESRQEKIDICGTRLNTVTAGDGELVVLIAGWPQSLHAWRRVFPRLAQHYRVIALDPPGMGDSTIPAPAYDLASVADLVHAAIRSLGVDSFHLVGHDIGAWISYSLAAKHAGSVRKLVLMDAVIPGLVPMLPVNARNVHLGWHFGFNSIRDLPEALTAGRERIFLEWFFKNRALVTSAFTCADLDEYERIYSAPHAMTSGFNYYRHMEISSEQNRALSLHKLVMPVLVVAGDAGVGARMIQAIVPVCEQARGVVINACGHYIPEEAPEQLGELLLDFLAMR